MRYKKDKFTDILRQAGAAGLSYGQYVARELMRCTQRKPIPKDCISINDRKRLKVGTPINCGTSTVAAALWQDCPQMAGVIAGRAAKPQRAFEKERSINGRENKDDV